MYGLMAPRRESMANDAELNVFVSRASLQIPVRARRVPFWISQTRACPCLRKQQRFYPGVSRERRRPMSDTAPSYAERRAWNQGTVTERLGILYSREAIVESLLAQKKAIKEKQAAYRRYLNEKESKKDRVERHERDLEVMALYSKQMGASDAAIDRLKRDSRKEYEREELGKEVVASVKTIKSEAKKMESLKSYWISGHERSDGRSEPELTVERPDTMTRCPATRKPLKLKDLIPVRFQKNKHGEHIDPVSFKVLTNASRLVVLKDIREGPNVLTRSTYERVVEPEGTYNGTVIDKETGVIALEAGGTGFAATNRLEASKHFAIGSKLQRGQAAGRSAASSGLRFAN